MHLQSLHSAAPTEMGVLRGPEVQMELTLTSKEGMRVLTHCSKSFEGTELICASIKCLICAWHELGTAISAEKCNGEQVCHGPAF